MFLRLATLAPRVVVTAIEAEAIGEGLTRGRAVVENRGYLPTYVLASARALPWNEPLRARIAIEAGAAIELVAGEATTTVGHLGGWGGLYRMSNPSFARTGGEATRRRVEWIVRGKGTVTIRAGGARVGQVEAHVEVG